MNARGKTRLVLWLVVVTAFVVGAATGAVLDGVYRFKAGGPCRDGHGGREAHHGGRERGPVFEEMRRDLGLTDEQAGRVRSILEETRAEYRALREETRPRYDQIRQSARERIRTLLTPEQQRRFDARAAERDARRRKEEEEK
jgi:Spy/CpxP family protein refolding chaperone